MSPDAADETEELTDEAVGAANAAFYRALEAGSLETMVALWAHGDDVLCAHPGRTAIRGWPDVLHSWQLIFEAGGNPQIILTDEVVTRRGTLGWVAATENLLSDGQAMAAAALNVFEHQGGRWLLVAHHAGPVTG